jgi:hypothetical protein
MFNLELRRYKEGNIPIEHFLPKGNITRKIQNKLRYYIKKN